MGMAVVYPRGAKVQKKDHGARKETYGSRRGFFVALGLDSTADVCTHERTQWTGGGGLCYISCIQHKPILSTI